jgi:fibronectin-binding autotransporter adhesin
MANGWWFGADNGVWTTGTNWKATLSGTGALTNTTYPGAPPSGGSATDIATFNSTLISPLTSRNVYTNGSRAIGQIVLNGSNRNTRILGGTSGAPTTQTLTLGSSGVNASASPSNSVQTETTVTVILTALDTPYNIPSTNASIISGDVQGSGFGIHKSGAGHLLFNGNNKSYTGRSRVSAGVLFLDATMALPSAGGTALLIDSGGQCNLRKNQVYGTASNSYIFDVTGQLWVENGNQTFPTVQLRGGSMNGVSSDTLGNYYVRSSLNGAVYGSGSITCSVGLAGILYTFVTNGQTLLVSGPLGTSGAKSGVLSKEYNSASDGGTLELSGTNLYEGFTNVYGGKLLISGSGTLGAGTYANTIHIRETYSTFEYGSSATQTISGQLFGAGNVIKSSSGTLTLSSASNSYSGGTTLSGGTLSLGADAALGTGTLTISGSSTINATADRAITNALSIGSSFTFAGANTLTQSTGGVALTTSATITVSGATLTLNGVVSGTGHTLTKSGSGTLILGNANTHSGGTTIFNGTVGFTSSTAFGTGILYTAGGAIEMLGGNTAIQNDMFIGFLTVLGPYAFQQGFGAITLASPYVPVITNQTASVRLLGAMSGTTGLQKDGAGVLTLAGVASTFTGTVYINAGTLEVEFTQTNTTGPLGNLTNKTVRMLGGTLRYTPSNQYDYSGNFWSGANQLYNINTNGQSVVYASALVSSGGSLAKLGAGSLTLSGTNLYDGGTTVSVGTLKAANTQALGTGAASVASGATLAALASINGKLNIGGTLTNSGGTLRIGGT